MTGYTINKYFFLEYVIDRTADSPLSPALRPPHAATELPQSNRTSRPRIPFSLVSQESEGAKGPLLRSKLTPPLILYWPFVIGPAPPAEFEAVDWIKAKRRGRDGL